MSRRLWSSTGVSGAQLAAAGSHQPYFILMSKRKCVFPHFVLSFSVFRCAIPLGQETTHLCNRCATDSQTHRNQLLSAKLHSTSLDREKKIKCWYGADIAPQCTASTWPAPRCGRSRTENTEKYIFVSFLINIIKYSFIENPVASQSVLPTAHLQVNILRLCDTHTHTNHYFYLFHKD